MLPLATTSTVLRLITDAAVSDIDVLVSWADRQNVTPWEVQNVGQPQATAITTATTTTILSAPASNITRNATGIYITNTNASTSQVITLQWFDGTTAYDLFKCTLLPLEKLVMTEDGSFKHHDAQGGVYTAQTVQADTFSKGYGILGSLAESIPRNLAGVNLAALTSGALYMQAIWLPAGALVSSLTFYSGGTASGTPTNGFFALYDINRNKLAESANFTTEAWAANTVKTKAMTTPYRIPVSGLYYAAIMITATTVPSLAGATAAGNSALRGQAPTLHGNSNSGLTTSIPALANAITSTVNSIWVSVS